MTAVLVVTAASEYIALQLLYRGKIKYLQLDVMYGTVTITQDLKTVNKELLAFLGCS